MGAFFIWLSGASRRILKECPTERPKYYGLGAIIVVTGGMAGVSLAFALVNALKISLPDAIVFAVLWGIAVMMIDRLFVATMHRQRYWPIYIVQAVPRLFMAVVLGFVISTPFVLQIFKPEITDQLQKNQTAQRTAYFAGLPKNPLYQTVQTDKNLVDQLTAQAGSGGTPVDITADPELKSLNGQLATANGQLSYWTDELNCQLYGHTTTGKTCHPGYGPVAHNDQNEVNTWQAQVDNLNSEIAQRTKTLQNENTGAQHAAENSAKSQLGTAQNNLKIAQQQLAAQTSDVTKGIKGDSGILAQLTALSGVTAGNPTLQAARLLLFLLFLIIDILPVFTKLLLNLLPASTYDKILAEEEASQVQAAEDTRAVRRAAHRSATQSEAAGVRQRNAAWSAALPGQHEDIMAMRQRVHSAWLQRREADLMRDIADGQGLVGSGSMPSFDGWQPAGPPRMPGPDPRTPRGPRGPRNASAPGGDPDWSASPPQQDPRWERGQRQTLAERVRAWFGWLRLPRLSGLTRRWRGERPGESLGLPGEYLPGETLRLPREQLPGEGLPGELPPAQPGYQPGSGWQSPGAPPRQPAGQGTDPFANTVPVTLPPPAAGRPVQTDLNGGYYRPEQPGGTTGEPGQGPESGAADSDYWSGPATPSFTPADREPNGAARNYAADGEPYGQAPDYPTDAEPYGHAPNYPADGEPYGAAHNYPAGAEPSEAGQDYPPTPSHRAGVPAEEDLGGYAATVAPDDDLAVFRAPPPPEDDDRPPA